MAKRELLSPAHDTASRAIVDVQTATTRVKATVTECVSKGISDEELTRRLNKAIAKECKHIKDAGFREQFRKSLVTAARKWHYELSQTYRINEENLRRAAMQQPLNIELFNLLGKTPYQKQFEFRRLLDDGTNPGVPVIKDYQSSVKLAVRALSAEPPKIVTTKNGRAYVMPARLRAEMAVRYAAAVENLQRLIDDGVLFCWISSHASCSPRCSKYQGKLYSLFQGKTTIDGKEYGEYGTIDGIPYRPINEALAGPNGDGNGCISGYNCRHRAIEYEKGSRAPEDFSKAEMDREYAVDKQQRNYENRIRQLKQEEKQLRACGMEKEAAEKRKQWRRLTKDYQIYSIEHDRAYYPYRYVIDRSEEDFVNIEADATAIADGSNFKVIPLKQEAIKGLKYEKKFAEILPLESVHKVTVKAREILRENNRKKEETAVCFSVETGEALFEQHSKTVMLDVDSSALNKQPADSVILVHNHPSGLSFSGQDLEFIGSNPQIHTMLAVSPDGKVFSLRTNCGKKVDRYIVSEYNSGIKRGLTREDVLRDMAERYGWEYKEV